jgi:hypothetical protein
VFTLSPGSRAEVTGRRPAYRALFRRMLGEWLAFGAGNPMRFMGLRGTEPEPEPNWRHGVGRVEYSDQVRLRSASMVKANHRFNTFL